ncbi:MAG: glycosyltransferase family 4 protein [Phycisphaerales bacterium]|jgi:glycosyltransferase involved in cell wall biosynthesis|nr:glycosyltransferase family 4 protein [Phycisphaerales bacterium]
MQIVFMTPGSGDNFYCENCLRDKALVVALRALGHDATSMPLYLPPLMQDTDPGDAKTPVFFGGVNVYLQQRFKLFRHTPRWLDKLFDANGLLRFAARKVGMTKASLLGETAVSMLQGATGRQVKELERLVSYLQENSRPDVVVLSNAMLLGMAPLISEQLGCAVVCMLQDEHDFIDALPKGYSDQAWDLMRQNARAVSLFIAPSRYYADLMGPRLGLDQGTVKVCYNGIDPQGYAPPDAPPDPPVIGYLSRLHPDKGLDLLTDAFIKLRTQPGLEKTKLIIAGGLTQNFTSYVDVQKQAFQQAGVAGDVEWIDDFDRQSKRDFLPKCSVMCVPDRSGPAAGMFVIESLLAGVPLVEPSVGVIPELIEATGGGLLYDPDTPGDMLTKLTELLKDPARAKSIGQTGRQSALRQFTAQAAARRLINLLADQI